MKSRGLAVLVLLGQVLAARAADADAASWPARQRLFDYEPSQGFAVVERAAEQRGGVTVRDVVLHPKIKDSGPDRAAYLVAPATVKPASCAAILWVHWLGPVNCNRAQFLDEAVALAPRGVVSAMVDAMWSEPRWYGTRKLDEDRARSIRQVIELRQALDVLLAQPGVDPARVAIVAHDYGAMHGMIAAAVDPRIRAGVWIAATRSFNDWAFFQQQPESMERYLAQSRDLELVDFLRETRVPLLLQFAGRDPYVPAERAEVLFAAAREPKTMKLYPEAGHEMTAPAEIRADRTAWLGRVLGLPAAP